jgi:BCD family chlorophyll transporter-like MFS transporter
LALATDLAPAEKRGRVVALMYLMLLVGTVVSAAALGLALEEFSGIRLIRVIHSTAAVTIWLNIVALWQQEARRPGVVPYARHERRPLFREAWRRFAAGGPVVRLLVVVGLGFLAFNLQDVLLEPYGGEVLGLSVSATTSLTGLMAAGAVLSFALSARLLDRGMHPMRLAMLGVAIGVVAFALVLLSASANAPLLFRAGATGIGFGEATFGVGTLTLAMGLPEGDDAGLALGAWGAVFATGEGMGLAASGIIRDVASAMVAHGWFEGWGDPRVIPYDIVYGLEILVLLATAVALVPLLRSTHRTRRGAIELADFAS